MRLASTLAIGLVVAAAATGLAQRYGGYGVYGGGHASTAAEGYQRGFADVLRSAGEANLRNSEAANNYQDARSKDLDNRLKATDTYFEMRRVNKSYRDSQRKPRLSNEQLHRIAAQGRPNRLDPTDLDPITGAIAWPMILQQDTYKAYRKQLETLFAKRAESSGVIGAQAYQAIQKSVGEALATLKENVASYGGKDYIETRRFLESLGAEASYPIS